MFGGQFRAFRSLLATGRTSAPRHASGRRQLARLSAISVAASSLFLAPLAPVYAADCSPTTSTVGLDTVLTFTTVGTCDWSVPAGVSTARVLIIGGGGGGGGDEGGGGGAGQFRDLSSQLVSGAIQVTVGAGGQGAGASETDASFAALGGGSSSFGALVAFGGGTGGAAVNNSAQTAKDGQGGDGYGSGGGGSGNESGYGRGDGGAAGTGFAGATPTYSSRGGGGGGAGGAGVDAGAGGAGATSNISGSDLTYAGGGGGGGGNSATGVAPGGTGGAGSGGAKSEAPTSASANSGSGGGGGGGVAGNGIAQYYGGNGGSGLVIVRFTTPVEPGTVQNFTASTRLVDADSDTDSVTLNWDALTGQTPAVSSYSIDYSTNSDFSSATNTTVTVTNSSAATPNSKTITGLTDGATYYFRIKAVNSVGTSNSYAETSSVAVFGADFAIDLNGSNQDARSATDKHVIPSTGDFTAEAWVNPNDYSSTGWQSIISQGAACCDNRFFIGLIYLSGEHQIVVARNGTEAEYLYVESGDLSGKWSHLAVAVDDSTDSVELFLNGQLIGSQTMTSSSTNPYFTIGQTRNGDFFGGQIDQVKVWSDVLSDSEVEDSMHAWQADTDYDGTDDLDNLISHYDFNDNTQATTLRDQAGSNDLAYTSVATSDLKPLVEKDTTSRSGYAVYEFKRSYLTAAGGWTSEASVSGAEALVVGGGGAGGFAKSFSAGGGGGGQVEIRTSLSISSTVASRVVVGQGGVSVADNTFSGTLLPSGGQRSVFDFGSSFVEARGGGPGSSGSASGSGGFLAVDLGNQGSEGYYSGGGGGAQTSSRIGDPGIAFTNGGDANFDNGSSSLQTGGGGGGAGGNGDDGTSAEGGNGGIGSPSSILGGSQFFGGGGGGGKRTAGTVGSGGSGVGGEGGANSPGLSADANSGGGGGGGGSADINSGKLGGDGGSGVVILAYDQTNTVTFNPNGGTGSATTQSIVSDQATALTANSFTRSGYTFAGWNTNADGTSGTDYTDQQSVTITGPLNLYAKWTATSSYLRLHYNSTDLNSFVPAGSSVTDLSGNSVSGTLTGTLPLDETDRDWTFGGSSYIDVGDLDSTEFANGLTVDFEADFGSTTEVWERIIDFGTGEQEDNLLITREGTSNHLAIEVYVATVSAGKCTYSDVIGSTSGLQRWTISIDGTNCKMYLNAASSPSYSVAYTGLPATGITWDSNFIGKSNWSADALFKGSIRYLRIYEGALTPAQIGAVSYKTVSFDSNGATDPASMVTSGAIALPTVTKTGYTFGGWYTNSDLNDLSTIGAGGASYTPTTSLTVYAKWTLTCSPTEDTTSSPGYTILKFTNTGTCLWTNDTGETSFEAIIVGGGGGGGFGQLGGGGGAGEVVVSDSSLTINSGAKTDITVGSGGSSGNPNGTTTDNGTWVNGGSGGLSSLGAIEAYGGGGGAGSPGAAGLQGGSSGGSNQSSTAQTAARKHSHVDWTSYANAGGGGVLYGIGGGGGGAGTAGNLLSNGTTQSNGRGGYYIELWGKKLAGGGGGWPNGLGSEGTTAATELGGNSRSSANSFAYVGNSHGVANTGTGGGSGALGGSGVVMLRYANSLTVTWVANGGTSVSSSSVDTGATLAAPTPPTRDGYTFAGWSATAGGASVSFPYSHGKTSDFNMYALWTVDSYTITFNKGTASGATGADQTASKNNGVNLALPDSDTANTYFTRTGYTVTSWSTNADGSTSDYALGGSYTAEADEILYPVWTANTYTITFNKGSVTGATGTDQTATKTHDQNLALPNSATANGYFTKTGYTVTGWSTSQDGSTSDFALGANYTTEEADTLYPVWTADTYTVTYSYDGATSGNSTASSDYTVDGIVVSLPTPLKTGYTFAGWYSESGLSNLVGLAGASYSPSADITLYAKWSAATFTVIFDYNEATGGNSTASDTFTTGGTVITLPTPTRTGYTFGGWYSNSNLTVLSTVGAGGASYSPTSNLTIYAKWTGITRNVTYNDTNSTGGSVPTDLADYIIGDSVVVKANSGLLARTGYTFAGWVTNADGTGTAKNAGETITVATADIELYPKWTANTYTITYNRNGATGGALAGATDTYTTGALSGTTLAGGGTMTKTGYSFNGWSTTTTGTIPLGAFTTTADVTVYAIWSPVDYDFDYDLNTGSGTAPTTQSANITETVTISGIGSAAKTGHWFGGWNTASDGSGSTYAAGASASIPVDGATLYAIWVPDQYRISYNANGGTGGPDLSATDGFDTATFGVAYTLRAINDLARTGYTFSHWSLNAAGTGDKYDLAQNSLDELTQYTPTANTTFYAQWTAVSYSHTFDVAGGSASLGTYGRTLGQSLSMPSAGTRTGYVFDSWTDGTNDYAIGSTYTVTAANKSFTAQWIPNIYTVTYDWSGGASATPDTSDNFTVGTGPMDLPTATGSGYSRDGYTFSGWSTTPGGSLVSDFEPTADDVLYAVWADGNYTLTYVPKGGTVGSGHGTVGRGSAVTLPTPVRANFRFTGWYDSASGGVKIGDGGDSFTPGNSRSLYARWVQNSLFGVDEATLESGSTYTASDSTGTDATLTHTPSGTSARVQIPAGALDAGTVVNVRYFKETDRQSDLIDSDNSYFFALLVSWLKGSGDSATVPTTATGKPITVTLNNTAIKAGAMVYQVIGDSVTELGRATVDGSVTVELTDDPEIVVAATAPSAPTSVAGVAGDTAATVSWTAGSSGGAAITSYTVTASPGGATCTTATTTCVVTGLTNNTSYTFSVTATNSIGTSTASSSSSAVTPVGASYVVTFNSNGGSSVTAGSFFSGGSVTAPTNPTHSGYTFAGWSTTLDDDATEVSFPYSPGVLTAITLYALWTENPVVPNTGGSGGSAPTPPDTVTPTPPATPVTKPIGSVEGSNQKVTVVADAPKEKLVATGSGWELTVAAKTATGELAPVREELSLEFQLATKAAVAVAGSGLRPKTKVQVWVFSDPTYVGEAETLADGSFVAELALPASILPGNHTMQILSTDALGRTITLNIPITVKGKVTVGTFKGYIAIYTADLEGQRLSAKVAGKWVVQDPISRYKRFTYSRLVRFTGAGYDIIVDVYINRQFYIRTTTRTR